MSMNVPIPRFVNSARIVDDPLSFLRAAQAAADGLVVISDQGPIFSRAQNCPLAVAVFGPTGVREVLNDADLFGTAVSVGEMLSLPLELVRLNSGLFSMRGEEHRSRQQLLRALLSPDNVRSHAAAITQGWQSFAANLPADSETRLLSEMRRLVLHVSQRIVFGNADLALGALIQAYFDRRRAVSSHHRSVAFAQRRELIEMGGRLDRMLRGRLAALREETATFGPNSCLLAGLMLLAAQAGCQLSDDELIAQANMLFMSSSEPVAVALTWTLLILSQQPALHQALRRELTDALGTQPQVDKANLPLLTGVIHESLRLLPPNAIMVRLTTKAGRVLGYDLPENCEVVLSPYVAHRDARDFAEPDTFDPLRWRDLKPSPYAYLPFGIGARYCLGRQLANRTLASLLAHIVARYDVVLSSDQDLDWRINVTFMPATDPLVRFVRATDQCDANSRGRLGGPVATLCGYRHRIAPQ